MCFASVQFGSGGGGVQNNSTTAHVAQVFDGGKQQILSGKLNRKKNAQYYW
jgi:hypothetical protein